MEARGLWIQSITLLNWPGYLCFCILVHKYTLCFTGPPCYNVCYYNYISIWPYYIFIHFKSRRSHVKKTFQFMWFISCMGLPKNIKYIYYAYYRILMLVSVWCSHLVWWTGIENHSYGYGYVWSKFHMCEELINIVQFYGSVHRKVNKSSVKHETS